MPRIAPAVSVACALLSTGACSSGGSDSDGTSSHQDRYAASCSFEIARVPWLQASVVAPAENLEFACQQHDGAATFERVSAGWVQLTYGEGCLLSLISGVPPELTATRQPAPLPAGVIGGSAWLTLRSEVGSGWGPPAGVVFALRADETGPITYAGQVSEDASPSMGFARAAAVGLTLVEADVPQCWEHVDDSGCATNVWRSHSSVRVLADEVTVQPARSTRSISLGGIRYQFTLANASDYDADYSTECEDGGLLGAGVSWMLVPSP